MALYKLLEMFQEKFVTDEISVPSYAWQLTKY